VSHRAPHTESTRLTQLALHCGAGPQLLPGHWDGTRLVQLAPQNAMQEDVAAFHCAPTGHFVKSDAVHRPPDAPPEMHVLDASPIRVLHLASPFTGSPTTQSGPQHAGRTEQMFATQESQLGVMPVAVPEVHTSCEQSLDVPACSQQAGFVSQILVTQRLQVGERAMPVAHGLCAQAPPDGLSQRWSS
jgi:hypothetical protein